MSTKTSKRRKPKRRLDSGTFIAGAVVAAIAVLGISFLLNNKSDSKSVAGNYPFQVGEPGPKNQAPDLRLKATNGSTFDLASQRGKTVLLYFQEGVGCQPCWDQLKDIEKDSTQFTALGIDKIVTITTNSIGDLRQKVADEGITTPVLSDPDVNVSRAYQANLFGMMGDSQDGHSFILVDSRGTIVWRADYGGAPKFTMYLPVPALIADIRKGLGLRATATSS